MKTAHWIRRTHLFRADELRCSACGTPSGKAYRSCPACGAPMRKTKDELSWIDEAEELSAVLDDDW